jgi:hypothetical protein
MYPNRNRGEVIGKILKYKHTIIQAHLRAQQKKMFFSVVPQYGKVHRES